MANKGTISTYLYFDGNCEEAVNYYAQVFELDPPEMMKYEKGKYPMEVTDAEEGLVMYASLKFENMNMMFSDDPNSHPEPSETPVIRSIGQPATRNCLIASGKRCPKTAPSIWLLPKLSLPRNSG